jgi:ubiquinone/menaquinone biosynthesis C-methylase UbiE
MSFLRKFYGFSKNVIVPDLRYSQYEYEDVLSDRVAEQSHWLDLGCGHHLLPEWRLVEEQELIARAAQVIGLDYDLPSLIKHRTIKTKVQGSATELPFADSLFEMVTANMVVEHLDNPQVQFREVNRVLKPGGFFIFHTPNEYGHFSMMRKMVPSFAVKKLSKMLDGRDAEDVFEVHYKANNSQAIENLAEENGFETQEIRMVSSDAVFAVVPPLAVIELLWIRILKAESLKSLRTNIIAVLKKK